MFRFRLLDRQRKRSPRIRGRKPPVQSKSTESLRPFSIRLSGTRNPRRRDRAFGARLCLVSFYGNWYSAPAGIIRSLWNFLWNSFRNLPTTSDTIDYSVRPSTNRYERTGTHSQSDAIGRYLLWGEGRGWQSWKEFE